AIGPCCYPVGAEVASALLARRPEGPWIARDGDRFRIDLAAFVAADLVAAGLRADRIAASRRCTACDARRLYSHRRDGEGSGRIGLLIAMRP
ncbi:MAG: polyphenol oxidase family protein, partial [Planctomycetes bacterium]|nr:polyphenol oxidase family protein [Planctomycetota bacterium]